MKKSVKTPVINNYAACDKKQVNAINKAICVESLTLKQVAKSIPTAILNVQNVGKVQAGEYLASFFGVPYASKPTFNACNIKKAWHEEMQIDGKLAMYLPKTLQRVPTEMETRTALEAGDAIPEPMDLYKYDSKEDTYTKVVFTELTEVGAHNWSVRRIIKAFTQKQTYDTCKVESEDSMEKAAKLLKNHKEALAKLKAGDETCKADDILCYCKGFHMEQGEGGKKTRKYEYEPLFKVDVEFNLKVEDEKAEEAE